MFKKQIKIGGQNQLSGKDRKNLKNQMLKQMKEQEVQHFFAKNQKILCEKVSGQKVLIYVNDQYPAFVDGTGKGDYFPTLYLLNAYPDMMKSLILNEGVQTYIFNGANLMWPGVNDFAQLGEFNKDQVVAIRNAKGEFVAVAAMAISKKELNQQTKKGIACYILHYLNDKLWEHGPKTLPTILIPRKIKKIEQKKTEEKVPQEIKKLEEKKDKKQKVQEKKIEEIKSEKVQKPQKQDKKKKEEIKLEAQIESNKTKSKNTEKDITNQKEEVKVETKQKKAKKKQPVQEIKKVQVKIQQKVPPPKQVSPQQSQQQDLSSLLHTKQQQNINKPVVKIAQPAKKQNVFSDEQDDKKKKKQKKGPQQQSQQQPLTKKKKQQSQEQQQQQEKGNKKKNKNKPQVQKKKQQSDQEQKQKQIKNKKKKKKKYDSEQEEEIKQNKQTKEEVLEQKSSIAPQIMDQYFKQCFLNALKLGVEDEDLPVDYGYFYTEYIQLARRQGVILDIKSSNYKKINKFYQLMQKQGFIETKQGKGKNGSVGPTIVKINRDNLELKNFQPTIKMMNKRQVHQQEQIDPKLKFKMSTTVQIVQVLKLKPLILPLFSNKEGQQKGAIYTIQQIKQHINKFLTQLQNSHVAGEKEKQKKKQKKQKSQKIIFVNYVNNPIIKLLFKEQIEEHQQQIAKQHQNQIAQQEEQKKQEKNVKKKKQRQTRDKNVLKLNKEDIQKKILHHTQNYYQLRDKQNQLFEVKEGKFKGIQITAQKSNNKNVTKIVGLETFIVPHKKTDQQIATLVHNLQQKFACSVSTLNLPGKNAGKEITVHGNFLEQLVQMFTEQFKIKKQYITTANKLDKKKEKRFN